MSWTKRKRIEATLAVGAAILALLFWRADPKREPVCEGRKLTSWLRYHVPSSEADPPYGTPAWEKADAALRHIGTNAIPTLLNMIEARDPPQLLLAAREWVGRRGFIRTEYHYAYQRHEEAEYAFSVLATNAASAVPELIRIYERNVSKTSKRCVAQALADIGAPSEPALSLLIKDFHAVDRDLRFHAITAVSKIGGKAETVVPALLSVLKDARVEIRWNAIFGLERYGRPIVSNLLEMVDDPGMLGAAKLSDFVKNTIWYIAPEKVGYPLVIEDPSSVVGTKGLTRESVKAFYKGERKTLIPAGKPIPAEGQYWSNDPRPNIVVYCGPEGGGFARSLGTFEVLDVPATGRVNISTVLVVADGRIVICARDNIRERFLQIRKLPTE